MPDRYVFPGITPFLEGELDELKPEQAARIGSDYYVAKVSNALAQVAHTGDPDAMEHALDARACLAACLAVCDKAIAEVKANVVDKTEEQPAETEPGTASAELTEAKPTP